MKLEKRKDMLTLTSTGDLYAEVCLVGDPDVNKLYLRVEHRGPPGCGAINDGAKLLAFLEEATKRVRRSLKRSP